MLAEAILRTKHELLLREAHPGGQFSSVNLSLFAAFEEQRHDARFGLGLLVCGFLLQLIAALGYKLAFKGLGVSISIVTLLAAIAWWRLWAKRLAKSRRMRVANSLEGIEKLNFLAHNADDKESSP